MYIHAGTWSSNNYIYIYRRKFTKKLSRWLTTRLNFSVELWSNQMRLLRMFLKGSHFTMSTHAQRLIQFGSFHMEWNSLRFGGTSILVVVAGRGKTSLHYYCLRYWHERVQEWIVCYKWHDKQILSKKIQIHTEVKYCRNKVIPKIHLRCYNKNMKLTFPHEESGFPFQGDTTFD